MRESTIAVTGGEAALAAPRHIPRRAIASWVLYDLANTIFSMGVVSLMFPLLVRDYVGANRADAATSWLTAVSMAVIFVVSPLLGALTDRARRRMPFLMVSTLICVGFTVLIGRFDFGLTAFCFIVANIAYQAGLQFYDALLPEVSTPENRGKIGGMGVGIGYLGSYLAVGSALLLPVSKPTQFLLLGLAFLLFSIPCFLWVRERGNPHPQPIGLGAAVESTRETIRTLRSSRQYPGLLRFLIGRVFYTDSINTVIIIMGLYTVNVAVSHGMSEAAGQEQSKRIMLAAITFAVAGGFVWGWLADRWGPRRTLNYVLRGWIGIFAFASLVGVLGLPLWCLYVVACSAGFCMGGVWAADRPYMLRLTPPARIGEFYGLYGMVGRFSAITGPILWGVSTHILIQQLDLPPQVGQGLSVLSLLLLMVVSYVILQPVSDAPREWSGRDLER